MKTKINFFRMAVLSVLAMSAAMFTSCKDNGGNDGNPIVAKFSTEKSTYFAEEDIQFTNESTGGSGTLTYEWDFGDSGKSTEKDPLRAYEAAGLYTVKLTVSDGRTSAVSQKNLQIEPVPEPDKGSMTLKWIGQQYLGDIRSVSPAVDNDGNVIMTSNDHMLYKFSGADGSVIWSFDMWNTTDGTAPEGNTLSSPSIDTDGTIYVGTGDTGGKIGRFYAVNSGGTKKWVAAGNKDTGFWNKGNDSQPRILHLTGAIGDNSVFVGNAGATGSVLALDKATGVRKGYVANSAGDGGPAGGVSSGVLLTKANNVVWYGGIYGLFLSPAATLESGAPTTWSWVSYTVAAERAKSSVGCAMAIGADGTIYGMASYEEPFGGASVFAVAQDGTQKWKTSLGTVGNLDQGGIVIDKDGILYASVKGTSGETNGGIVAIDTADGSIKWKFRIAEDVSGAPAIDQGGDLHFATDKGNYYIIRTDGSEDPVIVKQDLIKMIMASGSPYAEGWVELQGKCWSSPVIDDNGNIYVGITNMDLRSKSLLISLTNEAVTGLQAGAPWPMKAQNRRHTNRQP